MTNRRQALLLCAAGCSACTEQARQIPASAVREPEAKARPPAEPLQIAEFSESGLPLGTAQTHKLILHDEEWERRLTPLAFSVTRRRGTELAFTGKYNKHGEAGIYRCVGCNTALFHSQTKFDSGTGWPSFYDVIAPENVYTAQDNSLGEPRDEVVCRRCDAHLGHVFPDGPEPTRLRYCINSVALRFQPFV